MHYYKKLVRDKVPEVIRSTGETPHFHTLNDEEFLNELDQKLSEETTEYLKMGKLDELADIAEVLDAILKARGFTPEQLEAERRRKAETRGTFQDKIYLESVE